MAFVAPKIPIIAAKPPNLYRVSNPVKVITATTSPQMPFVAPKIPFVSAKLANLYRVSNPVKVITATTSPQMPFVAPKGETSCKI